MDDPLPEAKTVTLAHLLVETGLLTPQEARASGVQSEEASSDSDLEPASNLRLAQWIAGQGLLPARLVNKALAGEPLELGRYEVRGRVGRGGMGAVLKGHDAGLQRDVALKVLPQDAREDELERFRREAKALASLNHPNVVRIYSFEEEDGVAFFAMQLVDGPSLERRLEDTTLSEDEAWRLLTHATQALAQAEATGILHRDVKPGNILCEGEGDRVVYRLCDFGLARFEREDAGHLTQVGYTIGTPAYMSPEQARGEELDSRSDMYSLALTLHQALTGEVPFEGKGKKKIVDMLLKRIQEDVPDIREARPDVSPELASLLRDLAARKRKSRPANWTAVLARLKRRTSRGKGVSGSSARRARERTTSPPVPPARSVPTLPLVLVVIALSAVVGALIAGLEGEESSPESVLGAALPLPAADPALEKEPTPRAKPVKPAEAIEVSEPEPAAATRPADPQPAVATRPADPQPADPQPADPSRPTSESKAEPNSSAEPWPAIEPANSDGYHTALTAAEAGESLPMARVGEFLLSRDTEKALYWLKRSADLGEGLAMQLLGRVYEEGVGVPVDRARALAWYRLAADEGNPTGQWRLGLAIEQEDPPEARKLLLAAAQSGVTDAMRRVGQLLEAGRGGPVDGAGALRWYREAAQRGDPYAMHNAGVLLYDGRLVPRDRTSARHWFDQAVKANPKLASSWTYLALLDSAPETKAQSLERAAKLGERYAMYYLALALAKGEGIARDPRAAADWMRQAAAKGHPGAMGQWGQMLAQGLGVQSDPKAALRWHAKAAAAGDAWGMNNLAWAYENGEGVPQDDAEADRLYRAAAAKGNALAEENLRVWKLLCEVDPDPDWKPVYPTRGIDLPAREKLGASADSESAVQGALDWLVRHQDDRGRWGAGWRKGCAGGCAAPEEKDGDPRYDEGLTALGVLVFLGRGHSHSADGPYKPRVRRALRFLMGRQDERGFVGFDPARGATIYNHALATLALCEAYGLSGDRQLRGPAEAAVSACLAAQNPGLGWKYGIRPGTNDTSVTAWMTQALCAALRAGLSDGEAIEEGLKGAQEWFARVTEDGRTGYESPGGSSAYLTENKGKFVALPVMTAASLLARAEIGERRLSRLKKPRKLFMESLPGAEPDKVSFYYWYHATGALFHVSSREFKSWNERLQETLLPAQRRGGCADGSWDPRGEWCPVGGRVYATALAALTLEVYYRRER